MAKLINTFKLMPKELFRLNNGTSIALRDFAQKRGSSFDIVTKAGTVTPKALTPENYECKHADPGEEG